MLGPGEEPEDLGPRRVPLGVPEFRTALEIYRDPPGRISDLEEKFVWLERWNRSPQAQIIELFLVRVKKQG